MTTEVETNLAKFNATFERYAATWTQRGDRNFYQALEKKVIDLNLRLYFAFRDHQWGGPGKHKGIARAELDERAARGVGIKVRPSLMKQYLEERAQLRNLIGPRTKRSLAGLFLKKVKLWQRFVGKELGLRQSGINYLARAFVLGLREPDLNAGGIKFVKDRYGKRVGALETGPNFFRIIGDIPGQTKVDERYGIVASVLADATADMEQYFRNIDFKAQVDRAFASAA